MAEFNPREILKNPDYNLKRLGKAREFPKRVVEDFQADYISVLHLHDYADQNELAYNCFDKDDHPEVHLCLDEPVAKSYIFVKDRSGLLFERALSDKNFVLQTYQMIWEWW